MESGKGEVRQWALRVNADLPSQNVWDRSGWQAKHRIKGIWKMFLRGAPGFLKVPPATGKRRLTIERHGRGTLDDSNIIGGAKGIIDDLVQLKLLVDDKPAFLEHGQPVQVRIKKGEKPFTLWILEDVQEGGEAWAAQV